MRFAHPFAFVGILLLLIVYILYRRKKLVFPSYISVGFLKKVNLHKLSYKEKILFYLKLFTLFVLIFSLSGPRFGKSVRQLDRKVVDIMLVLDISGSMLAMDMGGKTRIDCAKQEAIRFAKGRKKDRLGLVIFAARPFLQCPLTVDFQMLKRLIEEVEVGLIPDGTAIGSALATAIRHIKDVNGKAKVIVLLTDGVNNAGKIDPVTSAKLASKVGIKVYTIGIGSTNKQVKFIVNDPVFGKRVVWGKTEMDEALLRQIAELTGGMYFRVEDDKAMRQVFEQIDKMEKHKIKEKRFMIFDELFYIPMSLAIVLILITVFLEDILWVKLP